MTPSELAFCPCQSGKHYEHCCGKFHQNKEVAKTALELMRSRYSAYALQLEDYLMQTWSEERRPASSFFCSPPLFWKGLRIIECVKGQAEDTKGIVEFLAIYELNQKKQILHERSYFEKSCGKWLYVKDLPLKSSL